MNYRERNEIVEDLVEELRECEYGTVTTLGKLLKATGHDDQDLDRKELKILWDLLGTAGNAARVYLDWRMSKDKTEGPVEDLEFMVYNKNATVKCPRCGSGSTARIRYRIPHTVRKCSDCGKEFGGPPLIVAKDYLSAEDYRDVVTKVEFTAYETFGAYTKITVIKNDRGALVSVSEDPSAAGAVQSRQVEERFWNGLMYQLYRRIYLKDWNKSYDGPLGRQGARWELRIGMTGRRQRNYHGSNVLTPYFKELMQIMMRAF